MLKRKTLHKAIMRALYGPIVDDQPDLWRTPYA